MKNFFAHDLVIMDSGSSTKEELLKEIAELFVEKNYATDSVALIEALSKREDIDPTIVTHNIAMPHAKSANIQKPGIIIVRTKKDVIWNSETNESARLFFMIGVPENDNNSHLEIISGLSTILGEDGIYNKSLSAPSVQELINIFTAIEKTNAKQDTSSENVDIVAVTACPTGIAHTYMAAESLLKEAKNKNLSIRIETNGSDGAKNILTEKEIANAKVVIIAADREVDLSRFNGKKLFSTSAGNAVRNAASIIDTALLPTTPIYQGNTNNGSADALGTKKGIYGQLMTGVSYMLPFVVGGGILIAIGFMFGITSHDPSAADYNPIAQFLNTLGGAGAFSLMIPVLAAYIGFSIGERPALMPAMVGGLLAANNGGGFLGGLLAGFAGGYVIVFLKKVFSYLPKQLDGLKPVLFYPVFGLLLMGMIIMPLMTYISSINNGMSAFLESLSGTNLVLLGLILGGMMAVDMGGPINKAAFTFGIAAISAGNYYPHAAVMAGGMVPPLGMALATTFAKKLFTPSEREAGLACYALGASFITEGAIPFAASHPLIVIPSAIFGSAVAGGLSMLFGCQLPAPHGGIFVFPLITNVPLYILSIMIGSTITATLTIFLLSRKKTV